MAEAQGWTASGFEGVRDAFENNFAKGLEIGAAFSAYHRGEKVVDLWGGLADPETGRAWTEDTLELVFSTTKGAVAICANKLAQEGKLDVDAPVAHYWPEFAAAGKADIPVKYLLSHRAGLAWIDGSMSAEEAFAWEPVVEALAAQKPGWEPGSAHGYHAITYGYLVGEVIRRVTGMSAGAYFRHAIGDPLGLDFWIGLPESEEPRVAVLHGGVTDVIPDDPEIRALVDAVMGPDTLLGRSVFAPGRAFEDPNIWNSRAMHAAEVPAASGVGDARSVARMYAACVSEVDGIRLLSPEQLARATTRETEGPNIVLMDQDIQFGLGFGVPSDFVQLGGPRSFGHFGAGGSVGWGDPEAEFGFGYVMNSLGQGFVGDSRSYDLIDACYAAAG